MRISNWSSVVCSSDLFTYFHELAHLVFHTSGIDKVRVRYIERVAGDSKQVEILCNSFAAQFLLPEEAFARAVAGRQANEATAEAVAAQFHVSREVVFRRFLEQGRIRSEEHTTELQSLLRTTNPVFCLKKKMTRTDTLPRPSVVDH